MQNNRNNYINPNYYVNPIIYYNYYVNSIKTKLYKVIDDYTITDR